MLAKIQHVPRLLELRSIKHWQESDLVAFCPAALSACLGMFVVFQARI